MVRYGESALLGRWIHVHEEDTDDEMVFRPPGGPLPPSRGRMSFELRSDGSYVERSPGPVDVPEQSTGSWVLDGDRLVLHGTDDRPGHAWKVGEVEPDRLVLRK